MTRVARGFDVETAHRHLRQVDPALAAWMRRIGPIGADPRWRQPFDPVDALARAILHQQLHGRAAATIVRRVESAITGSDAARPTRRGVALDAAALARLDDARLRACGVSGGKTRALRDLVSRAVAGTIPSTRRMASMEDGQIIGELVQVRGIGRWTVEMMLIFRLGRADVLPVDDFGVRRGLQVLDGLSEAPRPIQLPARGEGWRPYRSYASLYLWRIADQANAAAKASPKARESSRGSTSAKVRSGSRAGCRADS